MTKNRLHRPLPPSAVKAVIDQLNGPQKIGRIVDGEFKEFDGISVEVIDAGSGARTAEHWQVTLTDSEHPSGKTGIQFPEAPTEAEFKEMVEGYLNGFFDTLQDHLNGKGPMDLTPEFFKSMAKAGAHTLNYARQGLDARGRPMEKKEEGA